MSQIRFNKNEMLKASKNIRNYIVKNKKQPSSITMVDMDNGKKHTLTKKQYCGLFDNQAGYFNDHGRLPNYTTLLYEEPTAFRGQKQPTSVECGNTSLHNALTQLFIYITVAECKKHCKTDNNGTSPANLVAAAKKCNVKITKISRTYTAVKKAIDEGASVIAHIQTGGSTKPSCLAYLKDYGHWISIYNYLDGYRIKVYDPTKGYKVCTLNEIAKATGGRDIYFYRVDPLKV